MEMKKRVIVEYAERWTSGGIESYLLNLVKYLNKEIFEIHIVVAQKETDIYDRELAEYGIVVENLLPAVVNNPIRRMLMNQASFKNYFEEHHCDVLHMHICHGVALHYAKIAKKMGINKVISHCHNTAFGDGHFLIKTIGHNLGKVLYRRYIDYMLACSDLAAEWLYCKRDIASDRIIISKYLVEIDKFKFSQTDRQEFRKKYNIADDITVYLNIGRLHYQKNQIFLLDIFKDITVLQPNSKLVLIGSGELRDTIHQHARELNICENIFFVDKTREVSKFMSMSDVFLLPSLFEGNPIVGTEAQASGLLCIFSDSVTRQAKILSTTTFISLDRTSSEWAQIISSQTKHINVERRYEALVKMKENGYNVSKQIAEIETLYH